MTIKRLKKVCMWHLDILETALVSHSLKLEKILNSIKVEVRMTFLSLSNSLRHLFLKAHLTFNMGIIKCFILEQLSFLWL